MKRYTLLFALMISMISVQADSTNSSTNINKTNLDSCDTEVTSHTYLSMYQPFQSNSPELVAGFRADRTHAREDGWHGAFQAVIFGGRTTNADHTARYYFPFGKTQLLVEEDLKQVSEINLLDRVDLYTGHFGIETVNETYESRIAIAPRQTMVGGGLHWRQSIWRKEERGIWFSISFPIVHIKNEVNLTEVVINDGGGIFTSPDYTAPVGNMIDAFKQSAWKFGKINDCASAMKKTGVADLEIKFGCEWLDDDCPYHIESYIGVHVPTGNRPEAEYVMEAIIGAGKHVGIMFGNSFGCQLYANEAMDRELRIEVALGSKYLFKKEQMRSFDLNNKPWSRYIQMYSSLEEATADSLLPGIAARETFTPGINILTQEVDVTPGFMHSLNAAWVFKAKWFQGEIGYNLLSRQSECIKMNCFPFAPAIKHLFGLGQTNPVRDMTGNFILETSEGSIVNNFPVPLSLYSQSVLTIADINLASAATPAYLAHTVYGSLGGNFDECRWPILAHFGGSFTFSRATNAVMDRWTIWAKVGVSI